MKASPFLLSVLVICSLQIGCKKDGDKTETPSTIDTVTPPVVPDNVPVASYNLALLTNTNYFSNQPTVTNLVNQYSQEISGIAASLNYKGRLYLHEDSGNSNEVYITDVNGNDLGKLILDGIKNRDWEDIAIGPGPIPGKSYIYVAEIGDNKSSSTSIFIYRFPEPDLQNPTTATAVHISGIDKIELRYPNGPVNAETLMIDPGTKDLYIATKQSATSTVYVARYPQNLSGVTKLDPIAKLPFDLLTAGTISGDGTEMLLRNTGQIWYWKRNPGETVQQMLLRAPQDAPYYRNEHQGEAIDFASDASGYFTISEIKSYPGAKNAITFYKRN
ncbi:MAG: hypothetical protein P0Y49_21860 [Candidatus Pedobacter colombiensis]|uniref:Uncharacterized protein n=1 Tax=Candidatus Pedobacter colombiensis TaxID=3121371 RepID=A0AAJ5W9C1_9SPHI|nr:hypothetical protein [Pedobacter sp.]WEK19424.1 MAG: hypothetical protein P0Y49_21860 [Pedobacter sp.]